MRIAIALILLFVSVSFAAKDNDQHLLDKMQLEQLIKTATLAIEACDDNSLNLLLTDLVDFKVQTLFLDLREEASVARAKLSNQVMGDGFSGRCGRE